MKWKIAICVAAALLLQTSLSVPWPGASYADLPLVVVVYFALRLDPVQALVIASVAGLGADALGGGLLGAGGFSKTLTAFLIATLVTRIRIDNPLLRIPVLAGATLFDAAVYVALHRLLRQSFPVSFVETAAFKIIGTTVAGTFISYALDTFFSDKARQRRHFAFRRRIARRGLGRKRY
jgi:rod shape-determining protein MreD